MAGNIRRIFLEAVAFPLALIASASAAEPKPFYDDKASLEKI
jgi:hypothetical protein